MPRRVKPIAALLSALVLTFPAIALATALGANIVVDGDAEAASGTMIPGWTTTSNFETVAYNVGGGFPSVAVSTANGGGANFFGGGPSTAFSSAVQTIIIGDLASSIDAGTLTANLSAYLGGFDTQSDYMTLTASFLDGSALSLGSFTIGPVTVGDRAGVANLLFRSGASAVPINTRTITLELDATRFQGSYDDGYADNVSLVLTNSASPPPSTVPEPGALAMLLTGVMALAIGRVVVGSRRQT